jgi:hypothetical protein
MGLFDSLGSIFNSGSGATASAGSPGMPWANILGSILSSIRATPNPGASKGDMARAGRINLITSILGGLGQTYGSYQQQQQKDSATQGIFDILSKGGGEKTVEAAGPVLPGMARPMATTKTPLSEALFAYGKDNPLARDLSMSLGLKSMGNEREDAFNQRKMDLEQSRYTDEQGWKEKTFAADQAYKRDALGQQAQAHRDANRHWQLDHKLRQDEIAANAPYKQAANERVAFGEEVANELMRARLGAGGAPAPEVDKGEVGGFTPAVRPQATAGQLPGTNVAALMDSVAAKKANAVGVERLDKINNDPALRSATEEYRKGRQALESVAQLINTGELQSMDRQMIAKRLVQAIEPNVSVNSMEGEAALTRLGTLNASLKNWVDDTFSDGSRLGSAQIKRALDQLAINVGAQRRSALDLIENKRQYGAQTGVVPGQLPLIGNGFVDGGDPSKIADDAWTMFDSKEHPRTSSGISGREAELEMRKSAILAKRGWR